MSECRFARFKRFCQTHVHKQLNILNTRIAHKQVWFSNRRARLRKTLGSAAAGFGSTTSPTSYPSCEKQTQNTQPCSKKYNLVLFQRAPSHRTLATSGRVPWPAQLTSATPTTPRYTYYRISSPIFPTPLESMLCLFLIIN